MNVQDITMNTLTPTEGIPNANFNHGTVGAVDAPFPLRANDWHLAYDNANLTRSGIVNTQPSHWSRHNMSGGVPRYGNAMLPPANGLGGTNNNVYMLQNLGTTWQVLSSSMFDLGHGAYNILSFDVATVHRPSTGMRLYAAIELQGRELARIDLGRNAGGNTNWQMSGWQTHRFAIRAGTHGQELQISFHMGTQSWPSPAATAFIDNVRLAQEHILGGQDRYLDLSNPVLLANPNNSSIFFTPEDTTTAAATVFGQTLDLRTLGFQHTTITNNLTETLDGNSFFEYRVTARILTGMTAITTPVLYDDGRRREEPDDVTYGISLRLDGMDGGFNNLTQQNMLRMPMVADGGWVTLSFFIRTDSMQDLSLVIEFGNQWRAVSGVMQIRDTQLIQIDQADFDDARTAIRTAERAERPINMSIITEPAFVPPTEPREPSERGEFDWLVISSIILAVVIVFALVAVLLRRFKFNRHIGKKHTSYARDDASMRQGKKKKSIFKARRVKGE